MWWIVALQLYHSCGTRSTRHVSCCLSLDALLQPVVNLHSAFAGVLPMLAQLWLNALLIAAATAMPACLFLQRTSAA
jgi:hypothetical protein